MDGRGSLYNTTLDGLPVGVSIRKLRLFTIACGERRDWRGRFGGSPIRATKFLEAHRKYTDREITQKEFVKIEDESFPKADWSCSDEERIKNWLPEELSWTGVSEELRANLLRDIIGNPWKPFKTYANGTHKTIGTNMSVRIPLDDWLAWNDRTVPRIAEGIYQQNRFENMGILHDVLLDAGCNNQEILDHCKGLRLHQIRTDDGVLRETWLKDQIHVRGCWVIDLLTEKE